jgi:hypothetical protein
MDVNDMLSRVAVLHDTKSGRTNRPVTSLKRTSTCNEGLILVAVEVVVVVVVVVQATVIVVVVVVVLLKCRG